MSWPGIQQGVSDAYNSVVNMFAPPDPSTLTWQQQQAQIQRNQALADQLRQQAASPIDIQRGGWGAAAPISWASVLAKGLQGFDAARDEARARQQMAAMGQQDIAGTQQIAKILAGQGGQGTAPPSGQQLGPVAPSAPSPVAGAGATAGGGAAGPALPSPASAPIAGPAGPQPPPTGPAMPPHIPLTQMPGQIGALALPQAGMQPGMGIQDQQNQITNQMAQIMGVRGGPQTQAYQQAVFNNLMQRQNQLYNLTLPMSQAEHDKAILTANLDEQTRKDLADYENKLPQTADQIANARIAQARVNEEVQHDRATEAIQRAANPYAPLEGTGGLAGQAFLDKVAQTNPGLAKQIEAVGTYRQPGANRVTDASIKFMNMVDQAYPNYDQTAFATKDKARAAWATSAQGKQFMSMDNVANHLDMLATLAANLNNTGSPILNSAKNAVESWLGQPAPTTYNAVRDIAAQELVKGIVPGGGGEGERNTAATNLSRSNSPEAIMGAINGAKGLLGSQMANSNRTYQSVTQGLTDLPDRLSPLGKQLLAQGQAAEEATGKGNIGGQSRDDAMKWAQDPKNARDPRLASIKQLYGIP